MENKYGITEISFTKTVYPFCQLGSDYYSGEIRAKITPGDTLFDFCDIEKQIMALSGKILIIEELASEVIGIIRQYQPKHIEVTVHGESNSHFPVDVRISE